MNALKALLSDRKRSQRGSVLSAVLIIVAFLAIISGALMTELSTNFLLSHNLVGRVNTEATVNSAAELELNQLQGASLNAPCPTALVTLNGMTAATSVTMCTAVIDRASLAAKSGQTFTSVAASNPFSTDGTDTPTDYLVGDQGGKLFDFHLGSSAPRWTLALGGSVTATPLVMADPSNPGHTLVLIPASGAGCLGSSTFCLNVQSDDGSALAGNPSPRCIMGATSAVEAQPAAGRNFPSIAFAGDTSGNVYAINTSSSGSTCDLEQSLPTTGKPVVAGPIVFACRSNCGGKNPDEVFVLTSNGSSSQLVHLTYSAKAALSSAGTLNNLPANVAGMAVESNTLPSRLVISFTNGTVQMIQLDASANMSPAGTIPLPTALDAAPHWAHWPSAPDLIGVGGDNGTLYLLDTNLTTFATYSGSSAIQTVPNVDGAGNWYFAAADTVYEVQKPSGGASSLAASFGSAAGPITSSPVVASCPAGLCIYFGSADAHAYLLSLDARAAVLKTCISAAPPTCSAVNPRLWTRVEIGVSGNRTAVHVLGWSYYSP